MLLLPRGAAPGPVGFRVCRVCDNLVALQADKAACRRFGVAAEWAEQDGCRKERFCGLGGSANGFSGQIRARISGVARVV